MPRVTPQDLLQMKARGEKIAMLTAYDYPTARLVDRAGLDVILVGDTLAMVVARHDTTLPVTLDAMCYHTEMVVRATQRALVVADLPFGAYHQGPEQALASAVRLVKEGGAQAVKLEGAQRVVAAVARITGAGIPVVGHLGLTPQAVHQFGGFTLQGKTNEAADRLLADACALEAAGCIGLVLEMVPEPVAQKISAALSIPTLGIGAGVYCDGQVLVLHDLLGLFEGFQPRFVKQYAALGDAIHEAASAYVEEVKAAQFPTPAHSFRSERTGHPG